MPQHPRPVGPAAQNTGAPFAPEMVQGVSTMPARYRYGKPFPQGVQLSQTTHVPAVFMPNMSQGNRPDRNRVRLGPRIPLPWSQTTHVQAAFAPEMVQGVSTMPPRHRYGRPFPQWYVTWTPDGAVSSFVVAWLEEDWIWGAMKQNVAGQVVGTQMVSATDGTAFTGAVSALVTVDGGAQGAGGGTVTHEGNGFHSYTITQAETNGAHIAVTFTGSGAVPRTVQAWTTFPQTGDNYARLGAPAGASTAADIAAIKAETATILGDTNDLQTRVPAALVSGRIDASVGAIAAAAITAASIAADAITAAKVADGTIDAATFAAGAINAAAIAADAITDAKVAADVTIASVTGAVGSVTGAVGSVTGNVGGNVAGSVGSVTGAVGSVGAGGIAAASFAAGAIDAAAIAASAIGASEIAADALTDAKFDSTGKLRKHFEAMLALVVGVGSTTTAVVFSTVDGAAPSATNDHYKGRVIIFKTGTLAGQATSISAYTGGTTTATVVATTSAPANGDVAIIC